MRRQILNPISASASTGNLRLNHLGVKPASWNFADSRKTPRVVSEPSLINIGDRKKFAPGSSRRRRRDRWKVVTKEEKHAIIRKVEERTRNSSEEEEAPQ